MEVVKMGNFNLKSVNLNVLTKIYHLLKRIGSEKNIVNDDIYDDLKNNVEDTQEKEIVNALLDQVQVINDQMENMKWLNKHYKILHEFALTCSKTLNEDVLLKKAYEMVSQVMPTDSFFVALYNEGDSFSQLAFMMDSGEQYPKQKIEFGDNYTTKVITSREIIHMKRASQEGLYNTTIGDETSSCIFVPVIIDDHVKGVISAQSNENFAYRKEQEELLQIIGTQVINSMETARLYEKIYKMSQVDEMTGLKNYRAFHEDLSKIMNDEDEAITLLMIDSDNLKKINDNYGHDMGDRYLKVLSDGIKSISNEDIEGYRYAGDEFMVIIKSPLNDSVKELFPKLKDYYSKHPIITYDQEIIVSISSGIASYPDHGSTVDSLKKSADNALYMAKEQGRNSLVITEEIDKHMYFI
ncbi:sensor domain-containing diguanylate cyclase [Bacillus luteolus]|uniref:Sensor domain-containing diguanylate cyclase n=1 Tax=Litchfieldia luteola TaxID=682179 RepID=A0ABR9QQ71_9BACI|nr:sensor domain-containing diguanylate cyclase [Cytobacillus luteolus]MBE4910657.1 sensor domain-containing diguanylate cyclase [Cytobacillus luteolus]MBP1943836.1 diguanylate cyclase (GGDEF)-like protein [Cytobacillus luteolus]